MFLYTRIGVNIVTVIVFAIILIIIFLALKNDNKQLKLESEVSNSIVVEKQDK